MVTIRICSRNITYNPEKARELVKQAGFPNGVDVELRRRWAVTLWTSK